jgi:hypothetical protein
LHGSDELQSTCLVPRLDCKPDPDQSAPADPARAIFSRERDKGAARSVVSPATGIYFRANPIEQPGPLLENKNHQAQEDESRKRENE